MHEVTAAEEVPLGADAVWSVIGDFSGIRKWASVVEKESTEQTAKGKVRTLTMPGGRTVSELCTDEGPHHYTYTLQRPDLKAYFSTVSVKPVSAGASRIELIVKFEPNTEGELAEKTEQLTRFVRGNLKAMKRALGVEARA
ncbi:MAG TPA: SRPBCC family protein [Caulobacteraceae bacterium]|nr:SRPBCC family protein [Caulobacteraceae bacterium]